jgi:type IV pilus assembly protein PilO
MALPAFFDPLVTAPRWQQVLLGLMGVAIIVVGGYFLLISPLEAKVNALQAQHASLEKELTQARVAAADVARARREIAELERQLAVMKDRLPNEKEMPTLFRALTDGAYQAGLAVSLFQPKDGKIHDYYVEIPITISAEGGYHQVGEFFEKVAGLPRVVTVAEMKMTGQAKARTVLRADVTLATYQYRPVGSPPAPKPGQPAPPAQQPAPPPPPGAHR